jgi:Protein of unknown function (DUF1573)
MNRPIVRMIPLSSFVFMLLSLTFIVSHANCSDPPLVFSPSSINIAPSLDDSQTEFIVRATNSTDRVLDIIEYKGGCGCIVFSANKRLLNPGESVDVNVVFDFKDYTGPQRRTLSIITKSASDGESVKSSFMLTGEIPSPLLFSNKAAIWLYGSEPQSKELSVQIKEGYKISDLKVEDLKVNHFINVEQRNTPDGRSLSVIVTPTTTKIEEVSPVEKANLQVPYVVKYKTMNGKERYERFWVLLAKKPTPKPVSE